MLASAWIRETALELGFSVCGIARSRPLDERRTAYGEWLGAGMHDGLRYLERNVDKRFDPATLVDGAKSVIVCAVHYNNEAWRESCAAEIAAADGFFPISGMPRGNVASFGKIASYALARDYHATIKEMLHALLARIRERYPDVCGRCFTDSAPVLEKSWAVEAGLGWIGKNTLLISPEYGSFLLLGELVVDAEADAYDAPYPRDGCGACRRCLDACPNAALVEPRRLDLRRCISHLTIERPSASFSSPREPLPPDDPRLHGWRFGCDICQAVCPYNRHAPRVADARFFPLFDPSIPDAPVDRTPLAQRNAARIKK